MPLNPYQNNPFGVQTQMSQPVTPASNPFLRSSRSQMFSQQSSNPFNGQPTGYAQNAYSQQQPFAPIPEVPQPQQPPPPQQQQPQQYQQQYQQPDQRQQFAQSQTQQQQFQPPPQQLFQQQPQSLPQTPDVLYQQHQQFPFSQPNGGQTFPIQQQLFQQPPQQRHDKSSILALYNYPNLAPPRAAETPPPDPSASEPQLQQGLQAKGRSVTMPVSSPSAMAGSNNPFASASSSSSIGMGQGQAGAGVQDQRVTNLVAGQNGNSNRDSVEFWGNLSGRHSPDAFAGLSARFVR
ncbi:hypothetical protein LTS18_011308 [Coniosporium uncinatum]|uniref:Uncharacterized protein n=1 Tax=Coniosporium uncinatum TaxID=93489 RepID=A0ACC3D9Y3_9PEZI|nr:hypothetical protein LTS18_011308 [Coniosporium uncinatum]